MPLPPPQPWVLPSARKPLAVVAVLIVVLMIWRFVLGGGALPLGYMPGDLHYESDGFSVHFPWASCMLVSIGANLLMRQLQRR
ncbi:unnamed protein product [Choristocarpus tenellus]